MTRTLHIIDHNGLGGAQRLVAGILLHRPLDAVYPLQFTPGGLIPWPNDHPHQTGNDQFGNRFQYHLRQVSNTLSLPAWIKHNAVDILHCHLTAGWIAGLWSQSSIHKSQSKPILFHEHNPYISTSGVYRVLARGASTRGYLLAVSQYISDILQKGGIPQNKIIVLPNYVNLHYFNLNSTKTSLYTSKSDTNHHTRVGFAGRLVKSKGWQTIIRLAEILHDYPISFFIAGTGADESKIQTIIKNKQLEYKIHLVGFIRDIRKFYNSLDYLIFPSRIEPFGMVPLEAQACGVPVLAFNIPGVNEVINRDNAILIPPGNDELMAEKLKLLINDPGLKQQLIMNGQVNVKSFSIEKYLEKLEEIYQSIL